jgi:S1-C subfamily serine protease
MVPESAPAPPYVQRGGGIPSTTDVIPEASQAPANPGVGSSGLVSGSEIIRYENQDAQPVGPQLHSLQEFMSEGDITSPLGIEVREGRQKLKSGSQAAGLLVVGVVDGSPAARAGIHAYKRGAVHDVLEGVTVAAALVFPPAVVAVPIMDQVRLGQSYDLIIGVDGTRVTNFLDFEDRMRDVQPGEIVYLSVVRDGERIQVPISVPRNLPAPIF